MMKTNRIFALLLAAIMLLSVFTGCNTTNPGGSVGTGEHVGSDETGTTNGTTDTTTGTEDPTGTTGSDPAGNETISGTENTEPSNNPTTEPSNPTTNPSTQPTDPSDNTEACAHKFGSWTTKNATCTANGSKTRSCANCGKVETETIKATGHTMGSWSITKSATCDVNGTKSRKCSTCGHTETDTIAATGHNWDSGKVTTTPTSCSDMGIRTYTCMGCGKTKTEQIKGNHSFGDWQYEEYTYKQDGYDRVSHRKVRSCAKCGYKEYGNTPDHSCKKGSSNHTVTTVKEGTCTTPAVMRSTCKVCGWYVEYDGKKGSHSNVTETRHLTDYGPYTNELDVNIITCTSCGQQSITYIKGEGWSDYNRYEVNVSLAGGADQFDLEHPEYQMVKRNFVYDSNGYVKQFTVYWWSGGQRYSQVINCDKASMIAWFADYGLEATGTECFQLKAYGSHIEPYKISWTG